MLVALVWLAGWLAAGWSAGHAWVTPPTQFLCRGRGFFCAIEREDMSLSQRDGRQGKDGGDEEKCFNYLIKR
ncbi:hypothetical protein E2C01_085465 [Portunus trituberculatus]|uniref:Secreted protein n=1 Tax=Portunus trituberculatus TaxID=210409 RepID=A0A5B7J8Y5_PORTR|nr:hypothetical protein [Portunus trituberculatus]